MQLSAAEIRRHRRAIRLLRTVEVCLVIVMGCLILPLFGVSVDRIWVQALIFAAGACWTLLLYLPRSDYEALLEKAISSERVNIERCSQAE